MYCRVPHVILISISEPQSVRQALLSTTLGLYQVLYDWSMYLDTLEIRGHHTPWMHVLQELAETSFLKNLLIPTCAP